MTFRRLFIAVLLVAINAPQPLAQVRVVRHGNDRLAGIREVDVLVSNSPQVANCPVTPGDARDSAVQLLRQQGLRATASEKARSFHYSVVVKINTVPSGDACVSAVSSELVAEVAAIPEADRAAAEGAWGSLLMGPMRLADEMTLVISARLAHDAAVRQAVETQVAAIAARVRSANR